jgi:hypothetical protein
MLATLFWTAVGKVLEHNPGSEKSQIKIDVFVDYMKAYIFVVIYKEL